MSGLKQLYGSRTNLMLTVQSVTVVETRLQGDMLVHTSIIATCAAE